MNIPSGKRLIVAKERFRDIVDNLLIFIEEQLIKLKAKNETLKIKSFSLFSLYITGLEDKQLIIDFINNTYDYWDSIKNHERDTLLDGYSKNINPTHRSKMQPFIDLLKEDKINQKYINKLWEYLNAMVKCSIHFLNEKDRRDILLKKIDLNFLNEHWDIDKNYKVYETDEENESGSEMSSSNSSSDTD